MKKKNILDTYMHIHNLRNYLIVFHDDASQLSDSSSSIIFGCKTIADVLHRGIFLQCYNVTIQFSHDVTAF